MKSSILNSLALSLSISVSGLALADTIEEKLKAADALYDLRTGGVEATQAALAAYNAIIDDGVEGADLIKAVVGAARSQNYLGEVLNPLDTDAGVENRRAIFGECWRNTIEKISPAAIGFDAPEYYYFKSSCMAQYGQVSGTIENLRNLRELRATIDRGEVIEGGTLFEGGGVLRVRAAIISNPKVRPLPGGLYNPELALSLIDQAIASEALPGSYEGSLSCENFRRKVNILNELGRSADAQSVAKEAIEEFEFLLDFEEIPASITGETVHCIEVLEAELS